MKEENIKYDTRDEIMAFLKRQREIYTIEECDNIEQIMFDRVRKVLDLLMSIEKCTILTKL